ncbi:hypothetical protein [Alysiella filiformis]|uniref:Uncharacterized protein n=1 Tax=Alysiella filiformis DSM 16848 TaxID=1120981 RepID=A0A286EC90_9NEIS|nr:hypothetical protein [Alysiella filiformis]QMT30586.1 hypothetical protein H3L97_07450 [Alysiella filiformis]UBQ56436.1 hypothetical protein JF568_01235 [Alysiella filiformis DSM 16848]SOD68555.1 hypothetical protein SAMN02746062_01308 [Alysiella filiformis DSM 16848]
MFNALFNEITKGIMMLFALPQLSQHTFLYEQNGNKFYLQNSSIILQQHPIYTYAIVREQFAQPTIAANDVNEWQNPNKWVDYEKHHHAIDCQNKVIWSFATSRHSASGWQIEILPNELTSYPPLEYDHLMNGNERDGLHDSQLNQQQKQKYRDEHNPIIRAVCVA